MGNSPIEAFEVTRMLMASAPLHFLLEVILRSAFMFIFAMVVMRLLGRRAIHQLNSFDLLLIIALCSAMGDPAMYPDVAILWAVFAIASLTIFYRIQTTLVNRFPWYEDLTEGKPVRIITDGIIHTCEIGRHTLTKDEIFLLLRNQWVRSLGEVETAYLERDGSLSVFKLPADKQKPGLPTISEDIIDEWKSFKGGMQADKSGFYSCYKRGETVWMEKGDKLPECGGNKWVHSKEVKTT